MTCTDQEDTYISHLIECAISENTDQETLPGTSHTETDSIQSNQFIQVNSGLSPIIIQRHFGANDPFCLGSDSDWTPQTTLQSTDYGQDYSQFIIPKSPSSVNAETEDPIVIDLVEIHDDEESLIDERRKAENDYFQQFMSSEQSKSTVNLSGQSRNENLAFVTRIIKQVTSSQHDITYSNQFGSNRSKSRPKTFCVRNNHKKSTSRVKLGEIVNEALAANVNRLYKETVANGRTTTRSKESESVVDSVTAAHIELREIQENTYLKYFLDSCNKQETNTDTNQESERKTKKRSSRSSRTLKDYKYSLRHQSPEETSDNPEERKEDINESITDKDIETDEIGVAEIGVTECPSCEEVNEDTPQICGYCGLALTNSSELNKHLEAEHSEIEEHEAQHESENEYWRLSNKLVEEQRKRELERREKEKQREDADRDNCDSWNQISDTPPSRKSLKSRGKRYSKRQHTGERSRMSHKEKDNFCVNTTEGSGNQKDNKHREENKLGEGNGSDDDVQIIEPTIELVVIDSSDENEDSGSLKNGIESKIDTLQNDKVDSTMEKEKYHNFKTKITKGNGAAVNTRNVFLKECSVNLPRMKGNCFDIQQKSNIESRFTKLKKSKELAVNQERITNKGCKVILDRILIKDDMLLDLRGPHKETRKKKLEPLNSGCKIKTPQCSVSLEKLSPQNLGQTDMNNIIKYLINCDKQNKDKLLMQKYGIKDVSVSVPKAPTISEEVSKFFSRERTFSKLDDSLSEFSGSSSSFLKPDDEISWVSNRSVSPQPSTSSGHSYIPRKRTARKSANYNTSKRGQTLKEPKVILQNLSSIDIALLKNPNSSYRKSNWLNMFSEESSDSDDNGDNKIPIKSLLDNLDEGVTENIDVLNQRKGKGKAICRNNQLSDSRKGKSVSKPFPGTEKPEPTDIDLLKKFGITRSIVVLQDKKLKGNDKQVEKETKINNEEEDCIVIEDDTTQKFGQERCKSKKSFADKKHAIRKSPVVLEKKNKTLINSKKCVRKAPLYSPTALSLIRSARFKKSLMSPINVKGSQTKSVRRNSLKSRQTLMKSGRKLKSNIDKEIQMTKTSNKSNNEKRKTFKEKQVLHIKNDAQCSSVSSQKRLKGSSNPNVCKPFSISLTSIDRKNFNDMNLVKDKLRTISVKEKSCKSETISEQTHDNLIVSIKEDSSYDPEDDTGNNDTSKDDLVQEKSIEKGNESVGNKEVLESVEEKNAVNEEIEMEMDKNCSDNTEDIDIEVNKPDDEEDGKVRNKRVFEEHMKRSPSKRRKLSGSEENPKIQLTGKLKSVTEREHADKIPCEELQDKKDIDEEESKASNNTECVMEIVNSKIKQTKESKSVSAEHLGQTLDGESVDKKITVEKQGNIESNVDVASGSFLDRENSKRSLCQDGESFSTRKGNEICDDKETTSNVANNNDTEKDNSNCSKINEGEYSKEIKHCSISNSPELVSTDCQDKGNSLSDCERNETYEVAKANESLDNLENDKTKDVALTIPDDQSIKMKQNEDNKVNSIVAQEISKSDVSERKDYKLKLDKVKSKVCLNPRYKQSEKVRFLKKQKLDLMEEITVLNDQADTIKSEDKAKEETGSSETISDKVTEGENGVGVKSSSIEGKTGSDSCERDSPSNSIDVMDNQTKDVVGTCYIHQENSE